MKKAYISLGSNKGSEFLTFKSSKLYEKDFEFYAFEPEPNCFKQLEQTAEKVKPNHLLHIKKAAGVYDGEAVWQIGKSTLSGTLRKDKMHRLTGETMTVEVIDFSKWLSENFTQEDYIIVTIDIEGAEYDLLPYMLQNGTLDHIDKIGIEFHSHKLSTDNSEIENFLIEKLTEKFGDDLYLGWIEADDKIVYANTNWGPHPKANRPHLEKNLFNNF